MKGIQPLVQAHNSSQILYCTSKVAHVFVVEISKNRDECDLMEVGWLRVENESNGVREFLLYFSIQDYKQNTCSCIHHWQIYHTNGGKDELNLNKPTYAIETKFYL